MATLFLKENDLEDKETTMKMQNNQTKLPTHISPIEMTVCLLLSNQLVVSSVRTTNTHTHVALSHYVPAI